MSTKVVRWFWSPYTSDSTYDNICNYNIHIYIYIDTHGFPVNPPVMIPGIPRKIPTSPNFCWLVHTNESRWISFFLMWLMLKSVFFMVRSRFWCLKSICVDWFVRGYQCVMFSVVNSIINNPQHHQILMGCIYKNHPQMEGLWHWA